MSNPVLDFMFEENKKSMKHLENAQMHLDKAMETLEDIYRALGIQLEKPEVDDDGFELPHLDPEDDPDTRTQMEKAADEGYIHPAEAESEIPF